MNDDPLAHCHAVLCPKCGHETQAMNPIPAGALAVCMGCTSVIRHTGTPSHPHPFADIVEAVSVAPCDYAQFAELDAMAKEIRRRRTGSVVLH